LDILSSIYKELNYVKSLCLYDRVGHYVVHKYYIKIVDDTFLDVNALRFFLTTSQINNNSILLEIYKLAGTIEYHYNNGLIYSDVGTRKSKHYVSGHDDIEAYFENTA